MARPILHPLRYQPTETGALTSIVNEGMNDVPFDIRQVYVTTLVPGSSKGPIVHLERASRVVPLNADLRLEFPGDDGDIDSISAAAGPTAVDIPSGVAVRYINPSHTVRLDLLVLSSLPWSSDSDEMRRFSDWDEWRRDREGGP